MPFEATSLMVNLSIARKVPISIVVDGDGPLMVQRNFILEDREISIPFDTQKPFKLNTDTTGFCEF